MGFGESARAATCVLAFALTHCSSAAPGHGSGPPPASDAAGPPVDTPPLVSEAGFVDVPPQEGGGASYPARVFYAFHPAAEDASRKPLFVLFNGGPGSATSMGLLSYGTGPWTLVDGQPSGSPPVANRAAFTRFANLLYIDERITGFSYALREPNGKSPDFSCAFDPARDASDFLRVIFTFLKGHPSLNGSPVALMGESYGGARALAILHLLYHYTDRGVPLAEDLRGEIQGHFDALFPVPRGPHGADQIATQFGSMILIQPLVLGPLQYAAQEKLIAKDPYVGPRFGNAAYDIYDVSKPAGWSTTLDVRALAALADRASGSRLVGADLGSIAQLLPAARRSAVRLTQLTSVDGRAEAAAGDQASAEIAKRLGALQPDDRYLEAIAPSCSSTGGALFDESLGQWFVDAMRHARLFLTHARWDTAIYTPAITYVLQQATPTTVDEAARTGVARPGWIHVVFPKAGKLPEQRFEIRYPSYDQSGHMVAVTQGADLADDVEAWWSGQ